MNLRYSLAPRLTPKIFLFAHLLILIFFSLTYIPITQVATTLVVIWIAAAIIELALNTTRKGLVHLPDSGLITATLIVGILATSAPIPLTLLLIVIALLSKHFIRYKNRHLINPANLALLIAVFVFNQNLEWWLASNLIIIVVLGFFVMYKLRHIWHPVSFLVVYFGLFFAISPDLNLEFVRQQTFSDFSVYFFAFVMLPEPQTAPWAAKGRIVGGALTALLAIGGGLLGIRAPLIVALTITNIATPFINKFTYRKRGNED